MALAKSQKSLKKWTKEKWKTSDGKPSKGKKRYLPEKAWAALSSAEKAATNKAKASGNAKGKQFVKQPKSIAKKAARLARPLLAGTLVFFRLLESRPTTGQMVPTRQLLVSATQRLTQSVVPQPFRSWLTTSHRASCCTRTTGKTLS